MYRSFASLNLGFPGPMQHGVGTIQSLTWTLHTHLAGLSSPEHLGIGAVILIAVNEGRSKCPANESGLLLLLETPSQGLWVVKIPAPPSTTSGAASDRVLEGGPRRGAANGMCQRRPQRGWLVFQ